MDFQQKPQQQVPQSQMGPAQQMPMQQMPQQQIGPMQQVPFQQQVPSQDAPIAPQQQIPQQQAPGMQDHTHPEYDQLLVKMQELESDAQEKKMGGIQQEGLDEGAPEDDEGKPKGDTKDPENVMSERAIKRIVTRVVEELRGMPERDIGKDLKKGGPENTMGIPQSQQPPVGEAPSGGGFDSDDKLNEEDEKDAVAKTTKPAEYPKMAIQKNKLDRAKMYIERAKRLIKESNGEDPTTPNPSAEEENPTAMDGAVANKSPVGGTEALEDEEEEEKQQKEIMVEKTFEKLQKEMRKEQVSKRQSLIGVSAMTSEATQAKGQEFVDIKTRAANTIKEYLAKTGQNSALSYMQG